jgi:hypothetical protein
MAGVLRGLDFALADELDEVVRRRIFGGRGVAQRDDSRGSATSWGITATSRGAAMPFARIRRSGPNPSSADRISLRRRLGGMKNRADKPRSHECR